MKKVLLILLCSVLLMSCKKHVDVKEVAKLNVENTISTDRQYMYLNYGDDYRWYETCVLLKNFLDEDCDGTIEEISSVFQVVTQIDSTSFDTQVIMTNHTLDGSQTDVKEGFWVEDYPINNDSIISFKEAFDKLMATNCVKPHSRHCVLRKEVGRYDANPQYIFGNTKAQVYIDAVNGNVNEKNPAFVGGPLGEWP